jgi:transposase
MLQPKRGLRPSSSVTDRTARKVAQSIGVSVPVLYKWKKDLISDEAYQSMRKRKAAPQDKNQDALLGEIQHQEAGSSAAART